MNPLRGIPGLVSFERQSVSKQTLVAVMDDAIRALDSSGVDHLFIGSVASAVLGRPRWNRDGVDLDLLVRPEDAEPALQAFNDHGFATRLEDPDWIFKAMKDGVLVDLIFQSAGGIFLDGPMLAHSAVHAFEGRHIRLPSPEDLVIMKALAYDEHTSRYWHDALSVLSSSRMDWDYLIQRSHVAGRRILSLLLFAQAIDIVVPSRVVRQLFDEVCDA